MRSATQEFTCDNGYCIPLEKRCDQTEDCRFTVHLKPISIASTAHLSVMALMRSRVRKWIFQVRANYFELFWKKGFLTKMLQIS